MCLRLREQARSHAGFGLFPTLMCTTAPPVGASLLAIAVGQLASVLNVPPSSRASPVPRGFRVIPNLDVHHSPPVGASLLAIAVGQLAEMLNLSPPSRAGSLPRGCRVIPNLDVHHSSPVGAGLLAIAVGQLAEILNLSPPSRAGSLPQGLAQASQGRVTGSWSMVTNFAQTSVIVLAIAENWTVIKALRHSRRVLTPAHR